MKIIPVVDLLGGHVVHAVRGEREKYRPVESLLASGSNALDIAGALIRETGCSEIYVADLDAIQKKGSNSEIITRMGTEFGVSLLVDAAAFDAASAQSVKKSGADTVILGSETFTDLSQLTGITEYIPVEKLLFSIDISGGKVLSGADALRGADPAEAVGVLSEKGFCRFILLSLDMVGSGAGPDVELIESVRKEFTGHSLIAGGGVKYPRHLMQLEAAGADGVLVATSLHRRWITREDIFLT